MSKVTLEKDRLITVKPKPPILSHRHDPLRSGAAPTHKHTPARVNIPSGQPVDREDQPNEEASGGKAGRAPASEFWAFAPWADGTLPSSHTRMFATGRDPPSRFGTPEFLDLLMPRLHDHVTQAGLPSLSSPGGRGQGWKRQPSGHMLGQPLPKSYLRTSPPPLSPP